MLFFRQFWALFSKNWLVLSKSPFLNVLRCFVYPVAFGVFLATAQIFLTRPDNLGIASPQRVRNLASVFDSKYTLLWADATTNATSPTPSEIIERISSSFSDGQKAAIRQVDPDDVVTSCPQNFNAYSECWAAIVFEDVVPEAGITGFNYTIRADAGLRYVNVEEQSGDIDLRILPLQWAIDEAYITLSNGGSAPTFPEAWPYTRVTNEEQTRDIRLGYINGIRTLLSLALFVAFVGIVYHLPGSFMSERAIMITEHMRAMGGLDSARILSWHLSLSLAYLPAWILVAILWRARIFSNTSNGIMIILHILTGLSLTSWSLFAAVPFGKSPQLAAISTTFLAILFAIVALVLSDGASIGLQLIFSLIFPPAFYIFVISAICGFERNEIPTSLSAPDPDRGGRIGALFVVALIDIVIYPFLAVWWERSRYGAKNPSTRTWYGKRKPIPVDDVANVTANSDAAIVVKNLNKQFPTTGFLPWRNKMTAIEDLTFTVPRNGIFVLLGANGAGKSTVLSILGGLLGRNGGSVTFTDGGRDTSPPGTLGLVPQKNVLWDELTCLEHVRIWRDIKRRTGAKETEEDLKALLKDCDLDSKIKERAGSLSGGQKRKLQLAIGLVGNSNVLLVDEATSGVDPLSRRALWRALTAVKHDRTIIFTTHFLDEADLLGDNVVVLAAPGKLLAEGSPVSLKTSLGVGYTVTVSTTNTSNPHEVLRTIQRNAPQTTITSLTTEYVDYALKTKDPVIVQKVLESLEAEKANGAIAGYDVNGTSLEDIFIDLMSKDSANRDGDAIDEEPKTPLPPTGFSTPGAITPTELKLSEARRTTLLSQTFTIFYKRLLIVRRSWLSPILAMGIALAAACIPLFWLDDRVSTCEVTFRASTSTPLYLPFSPLSGANPSSEPGADSRLRFAPPPVLDDLSESVQSIDAVFLSDRQAFDNEFRTYTRNLTTGGLWSDDGQSVFAYEASENFNGQIILNTVSNVLLAENGGDGRVIAANYMPFPLRRLQGFVALQWLTFFGAGMAVYPAFFTLYVSKERRSSVQAMQLSNGISNPAGLWLGHLLFDSIPGLIIATVATIVFVIRTDEIRFPGLMWLIMALYAYTGTLFAYCASLLTKSALAAFSVFAGYQIVMFMLYLSAYMLTLTYAAPSETARTIEIIHYTMSLLTPINPLLRATIVSLNLFNLLCDGEVVATTPAGFSRYGSSILYLILYGILLFCILVWVDTGLPFNLSNLIHRRRRRNPEAATNENEKVKEDVVEETKRVEQDQSDPLRVLHVSKRFGGNQAVDDVSFGVGRNTIFAMLGPNGAGKTTTFNIIRGEVVPNSGDVEINNYSITTQASQARVSLGVCPQFTAIDSQLTVREHLNVYGRLKGLRTGGELEGNVNTLLDATALGVYADRLASKLSGGNQRKLALAIALIGNPSVLLIDEFSTGIAPDTKRNMWKTLRKVVPGKAVVITTHSMEEATALSNKVGIIARKMLAVGTTGELASRFPYYEIHFSVRTRDELNKAQALMARIPGAKIANDVATRFEVPLNDDVSLAKLFQLLSEQEDFKEFSVDRVGLESVFLKVIRENNVTETENQQKKKRRWWSLRKSV